MKPSGFPGRLSFCDHRIGAPMDIAEFVRIALRYDTLIARAMLRACGWPVGVEVGAWEPEPPTDRDVAWCFANHGSPMDGRIR